MLASGGAAFAARAVANAAGSGLDRLSILSCIGGGGVGGAIIMLIVGVIKSQMNKS